MVDIVKCPVCGSSTRLRTSKKDGSKFHVCVNWPDCKGKVAFDDWEDDWEEKPLKKKPQHSRPVEHRTSGFAIASLILGVLGISLLAIIFGAIALGETRRPGVEGRGMAIAGIVLGILWIVAGIIVMMFAWVITT